MSDPRSNEPDEQSSGRQSSGEQSWTSSPDWTTPPTGGYPPQPPTGYPPQPSPGYGYGQPGYRAQPWTHAPMVNKPSSNLVGAILVTLFCCLPFGIVSIVYAAQVDSKWNAGDWVGAERAAKSARTWLWAGVIGGIAVGLLWGLVVVGSGGSSSGRY